MFPPRSRTPRPSAARVFSRVGCEGWFGRPLNVAPHLLRHFAIHDRHHGILHKRPDSRAASRKPEIQEGMVDQLLRPENAAAEINAVREAASELEVEGN